MATTLKEEVLQMIAELDENALAEIKAEIEYINNRTKYLTSCQRKIVMNY